MYNILLVTSRLAIVTLSGPDYPNLGISEDDLAETDDQLGGVADEVDGRYGQAHSACGSFSKFSVCLLIDNLPTLSSRLLQF